MMLKFGFVWMGEPVRIPGDSVSTCHITASFIEAKARRIPETYHS